VDSPEPPQEKKANYAPEHTVEEKNTRTILLQKAQNFKTFIETLESGTNSQALQATIDGESFLYLQPVDGNVYHFKVVSYSQINQDNYFTLSEAGVTHFQGGQAGSTEFTSLDQYEREYYLYSMITEIPFFKKYRAWKSFVEWKKNVSQSKIAHCKRQLQEDLFILHPLLRQSMMQLRELCYKVSVYKLFRIDQKNTYTLEEFCRLQEQQKVQVNHHLRDFSEEVSQLVQEACEAALRQFLAQNGFTADQGGEAYGNSSNGGGSETQGNGYDQMNALNGHGVANMESMDGMVSSHL
jgi:dynein heavy chain